LYELVFREDCAAYYLKSGQGTLKSYVYCKTPDYDNLSVSILRYSSQFSYRLINFN